MVFKATGKEYYAVDTENNSIYIALENFLRENGHRIYPHEIVIWGHGILDMASMSRHGELYAWEIKNKGDNIHTGIEQSKGYQVAFDFTYIVGTVKPQKKTLIRMENLHIGYVYVEFTEDDEAYLHCLCKAPLMHTIESQRQSILKRFEGCHIKNTGQHIILDDFAGEEHID